MKSFTICLMCKKKKFARKEIIKKRVERGNIENWICRDCKKELRFEEINTSNNLEEVIEEPTLTSEEEENEKFFAK